MENLVQTKPQAPVHSLDESRYCFSEEHVKNSLIEFLKKEGYKIHLEQKGEAGENIVAASKYFRRELIGIKGFPSSYYAQDGRKKSASTTEKQHAKNWFSDIILGAFTNFSYFHLYENVTVAIALPNSERYKSIIERVQDYFSDNDLSFKIYLVDESGEVTIQNLNEKRVA